MLVCVMVIAVGSIKATAVSPHVTLAWDASISPVAGYRIYYGNGSGVYTNIIDVGAVSSATVSNLVAGSTYYFAATAYDTAGLESTFSSEISYAVPTPTPRLSFTMKAGGATVTASGAPGVTYALLSSADLQHWSTLASLTTDNTGSCQFTDSTATNTGVRFYRLEQTSP